MCVVKLDFVLLDVCAPYYTTLLPSCLGKIFQDVLEFSFLYDKRGVSDGNFHFYCSQGTLSIFIFAKPQVRVGIHFHFHSHWPQSLYTTIIPSWEWPQTDSSMPWANLTKDTLMKYNKQKTPFLCKIFVNFGHILIRYGLYFYCCMLRSQLEYVCSALSLALHRYAGAGLLRNPRPSKRREKKKGIRDVPSLRRKPIDD